VLDTFSWTNGVVFSAPHATVIAAVEPSWNLLAGFAEPGAIFGYVFDGENAVLLRDGGHYTLKPGTFFAVNTGGAELCSPGGRILLVYQPRADFPFQLGAVERIGRLRYIDGCTDSLLVPPWRRGEACLNHLHIPPGVEQTMHTHPSDRIGVVIRGRGQCVTPDGITELAPGVLWRIPADGLHRFRTPSASLDVIAFHPDSDTGPTDDDHPMVRKTFVDGVSAAEIDRIRTR
jgi:quercetin dioxygenase-like cupin family protein